MDNSIRIPLDLPDIHVLNVSKTDPGAWLIRIESTLNGPHCHQCSADVNYLTLTSMLGCTESNLDILWKVLSHV